MRIVPLRLPFFLAASILAVAGISALGQSSSSNSPAEISGVTVRQLHPKPTGTVFPLIDKTPARTQLTFRAPDQMTASDRQLAEENQGEIARRAAFQGFHLDSGRDGWGYEQAVCPVFPNHLILEYSRTDGRGDVTLFSAVIPRGEGHVRVIPVRRRSYSLWTPSSSNALTLNDFNHMVVEGRAGLNPDWLTLGLCYAALAGGHVRAALVSQLPDQFPLYPPPRLVLDNGGKARVEFTDVTADVPSMEWKMDFTPTGRLLKVKHERVSGIVSRPVAGAPIDPSDLSKAGN